MPDQQHLLWNIAWDFSHREDDLSDEGRGPRDSLCPDTDLQDLFPSSMTIQLEFQELIEHRPAILEFFGGHGLLVLLRLDVNGTDEEDTNEQRIWGKKNGSTNGTGR